MGDTAGDNTPSNNPTSQAEEGSEPERALMPIQERRIEFYGDEIRAVLVERDGQQIVYVPLRPISDYLGLSWSGQYERIKRDTVLSEGLTSVRVTRTEVGQRYTVLCLDIEMLHGWLFGVDTNRVKPALKEKLDRYRRECIKVLARAFQTDELTTKPKSAAITALEQVRETGRALMVFAEQQLEHERRLEKVETRLDNAAHVVGDINHRLAEIEERTAPQQFITAKQAGQISNQVKALAMHLTKRDNTKNHYGAIFGAIHHYFNVTSVERITRGQFEEVMAMLDEWREAADAAPPGKQLDLFSLDAPAAPQQVDEPEKPF